MARVDRQKKKLVGLIYDQYTEPAHALTDKAHQMAQDGVLTDIPPEKCVSRHDEIQGQKSDQQLSFDNRGSIKVQRKALDLECNVSGELRLGQAFTRRSIWQWNKLD